MKDKSKDTGGLGKVYSPLPPHFDLEQIFDCGQAFRFIKEKDESYTGVAFGRAVNFAVSDGRLMVTGASNAEFENIWRPYLDFDRDYGAVRQLFSGDPVMAAAMDFAKGIRVLRQEPFEALISFILSQNNNIPRIRSLVEGLCRLAGRPVEFMGRELFTFPAPRDIVEKAGELNCLRCGYRAPYIEEAAKRVLTGALDFAALDKLPTGEARLELLSLPGVGPKVADCFLLFGMGRFDAFPVDVWMERAINILYDAKTFDPALFGDYCGIAQQYLFYYARQNGLGKKPGISKIEKTLVG